MTLTPSYIKITSKEAGLVANEAEKQIFKFSSSVQLHSCGNSIFEIASRSELGQKL